MKEFARLKSITELHKFLGLEKPKHPLVSVLRLNQILKNFKIDHFKYSLELYQVSLKDNCPFVMVHYGRNSYDFQEATMIFTAPNQALEYQKAETVDADGGWTLLFHPDFIRKTELGKKIDNYSFFDYAINEALHVSDDEKISVTEIVNKIEKEYNSRIDAHSQTLIISNLELLLNYCARYYDRQFFTRSHFNKGLVAQFERLLKKYYQSEKAAKIGFPTVQYCGNALNLSPKYVSDLLRKETGRNAQDHIHQFVIDRAKTILLSSNKSVNEIAYELGFEYPQYFSRMFKKKTLFSPTEFRDLN